MSTTRDLSRYRPNVGIVLFNSDGLAWLGRRHNAPQPYVWQWPQGGVDEGEDLEAAARRELLEETGVSSIEIIGRTPDWLVYDFPPEVAAQQKAGRNFLGQKQVWFAARFTGQDSEIDLHAHHEIEFSEWRWARLDEAVDLIVPFKRDVYQTVAEAFRARA